MKRSNSGISRNVLVLLVALLVAAILSIGETVSASILGAMEEAYWSDMSFVTGVTGSFNSGTKELMVSTTMDYRDLEIGEEFGPNGSGRHYGTGGTLGGPFKASLSVSGVIIQPNGKVSNGGSVVVTLGNSAPGSIGTDYGIASGAILLQGSVLEVLLNSTGDNKLDVSFSITGGALQNINPSLGVNFAPSNLGLIRFGGPITLPDDFLGSFSLNGASVNVFGLPESSYTTLVLFSAILAWFGGSRRGLEMQRAEDLSMQFLRVVS